MKTRRLKLNKILTSIVPNVYHQPPESIKMTYPCIRYELSSKLVVHSDNKKYLKQDAYTVTIIDKNPDSELPDKLEEMFDYCRFDRRYTADNLNHWFYTLYY